MVRITKQAWSRCGPLLTLNWLWSISPARWSGKVVRTVWNLCREDNILFCRATSYSLSLLPTWDFWGKFNSLEIITLMVWSTREGHRCFQNISESKPSHSTGLIYLVHMHLHSCFRNRPAPCWDHCCVFVSGEPNPPNNSRSLRMHLWDIWLLPQALAKMKQKVRRVNICKIYKMLIYSLICTT